MRYSVERNTETASSVVRESLNQQTLAADIKLQYDIIVCGSGSSGSVVARPLAENPNVSVLLLEAGGSDNVPVLRTPTNGPSISVVSERALLSATVLQSCCELHTRFDCVQTRPEDASLR
jgi:GMC oxidoreductase